MPIDDDRKAFIADLAGKSGISPNTRDAYDRDLRHFADFLRGSGMPDADSPNESHVPAYVGYMGSGGAAVATINRRLAAIRSFLAWSGGGGGSRGIPGVRGFSRREAKGLPPIPSVPEVDRLLSSPIDDGAQDTRDKAMLEVLYATGLRASELVALGVADVVLGAGYVHCSRGRERVIPLGGRARESVAGYLAHARPTLLGEVRDDGTLFLNRYGKPLTRQGFWKIVKRRAEGCGIAVPVTPNTLRHAFAVHMLAGGADLKSIQGMLGLADMASIRVYAEMTGERLADVYARAHPRA